METIILNRFLEKYNELDEFFLTLGLESFICRNIRNFFKVSFFCFLSLESSLLKYKKFLKLGAESCISQNIRKSFFEEIQGF